MPTDTKVSSANGAQAARAHYRAGDDAERARVVANVKKALDELGPGQLSAAQLAPLDQFHVRGLVATAELAKLAGLDASSQVLDAGSGLGGPARFLAETHGCEVTGVDLSPTFVALARELARRSPVASRVHFDVADLCALPFEDGRFDVDTACADERSRPRRGLRGIPARAGCRRQSGLLRRHRRRRQARARLSGALGLRQGRVRLAMGVFECASEPCRPPPPAVGWSELTQ